MILGRTGNIAVAQRLLVNYKTPALAGILKAFGFTMPANERVFYGRYKFLVVYPKRTSGAATPRDHYRSTIRNTACALET